MTESTHPDTTLRRGVVSERPAIIQYWHEERVPGYIEPLLASFRECNPDTPLLLFDRDSAEAFIAGHFGPREVDAFRLCAVPAMQADYFRVCALLVMGGMWCDIDSRCKASLEPLLRRDGVELFRLPVGWVNNSHIVARSPGHPFFQLALEITTVGIEERITERVDFVTGPAIFTTMVEAHRMGSIDAWLAAAPKPLPSIVLKNRRYTEFVRGISPKRLDSAMRDVRIASPEKLDRIMAHYLRLPYKETPDYHGRFEGSIYTSPRGGRSVPDDRSGG